MNTQTKLELVSLWLFSQNKNSILIIAVKWNILTSFQKYQTISPSVRPRYSVVRQHTNTTHAHRLTFFTHWRCCYCRRRNAWSGHVLRTCMSETWCRHEEQSGSGSRQTDITNRAQIMMMTVTKMSRNVSGSEEAQLTLNAQKSWY